MSLNRFYYSDEYTLRRERAVHESSLKREKNGCNLWSVLLLYQIER